MTKLRARGALRREAAGEGTDFVVAADVDDRALEDCVYRKAIDHCLDLAIVERAAIAREEIVDRCTMFEFAFAHFPISMIKALATVTQAAEDVLERLPEIEARTLAAGVFCSHCWVTTSGTARWSCFGNRGL